MFKSVNDTYGHGVGDDVLRKIATILQEQFRGSDYVARIGGDEFAVLMTKIADSPKEGIVKKCEKINSILLSANDGLPPVSLSIGVAISDEGYSEELESQADKALYLVKREGRCNCAFYR